MDNFIKITGKKTCQWLLCAINRGVIKLTVLKQVSSLFSTASLWDFQKVPLPCSTCCGSASTSLIDAIFQILKAINAIIPPIRTQPEIHRIASQEKLSMSSSYTPYWQTSSGNLGAPFTPRQRTRFLEEISVKFSSSWLALANNGLTVTGNEMTKWGIPSKKAYCKSLKV